MTKTNEITQTVNFMLSLPISLREQIRVAAVHTGLTMNNFILVSVQEKLNKINEEK